VIILEKLQQHKLITVINTEMLMLLFCRDMFVVLFTCLTQDSMRIVIL